MKRDMEIIRTVALEIASFELPALGDQSKFDCSDNIEETILAEHLELMLEAGLIDARRSNNLGNPIPTFRNIRLTWDGQEFVDQVRSEEAWGEAKTFMNSAGSFTLPVIQQLLTNWATGHFPA